jgi:hypothetical protein
MAKARRKYIIQRQVTYTNGQTVVGYFIHRGLFVEFGNRSNAKVFNNKTEAKKELKTLDKYCSIIVV